MTPLEIVIERVDHAEARVRGALLVLATLFTLILLFQFSQMDRSWSVVRHALAQRGELWFACQKDPKLEACTRLAAGLNNDQITDRAVRSYVDQRLFLEQDAEDARRKQQEIYFDNVLRFNIPPLGVSVDSQDIAPVAAFGFSALLLWLAVCLDNQTRALRGFITLLSRQSGNHPDWVLASDLVVQPILGVVSKGTVRVRLAARFLQVLLLAPLVLVIWINVYGYQTSLFFGDIVPNQVALTLRLGTLGALVLSAISAVVVFQIERMPAAVRSRSRVVHEEEALRG